MSLKSLNALSLKDFEVVLGNVVDWTRTQPKPSGWRNGDVTEVAATLEDLTLLLRREQMKGHGASDLLNEWSISLIQFLYAWCSKDAAVKTPAHLEQSAIQEELDVEKAKFLGRVWGMNVKGDSSIPGEESSVDSSTLTLKQLCDVSWSLSVVVSTDQLQQVGSTLVQLQLAFDDGSCQMMELTVEEFYESFANLEAMKAQINATM